MKKLLLISTLLCSTWVLGQANDSQMGNWMMYFVNKKFDNSRFGVQGDVQYRNWNLGGDLEQLLLRGGLTYRPKSTDLMVTLGYANITTGERGDGNDTSNESRIYQEFLFPSKIGPRIYINHRFRSEQRFVEDQDFRSRYRYMLNIAIPLNGTQMQPKTYYFAAYNEIFVNGEKSIGNGNTVELFDRNRLYLGLGYQLSNPLRVQLGVMNQSTNATSKNQWQISLHHNF